MCAVEQSVKTNTKFDSNVIQKRSVIAFQPFICWDSCELVEVCMNLVEACLFMTVVGTVPGGCEHKE